MQAENTEALESFKWRINRAAEAANLTQTEVAQRLGFSTSRVGNWFQGRNLPSQRAAVKIAGLLATTAEWLLEGRGEMNSAAVVSVEEEAAQLGGRAVRAVPLVSWTHAGQAATYEELAKHERGSVSSMSRDRRAFALTIEGDSMEPKFLPGDRVICEPSTAPINGKAVVARFNDDGVQLRIFQKMPAGKIRLIPINTGYAPTEHTLDEFHWIYPVVELNRPI